MSKFLDQLEDLRRRLELAERECAADKYFKTYRDLLQLYRSVSKDRVDPEPLDNEKEYSELYHLAHDAIIALGGEGELSLESVADYDATKHGPMLGVSNEGGATAAIRHGALMSPKCCMRDQPVANPLFTGVAHDAERLGAIGEVVVGPDEYATIRLSCRGRLLTTTNVGTRVNVRLYLAPPVVKIKPTAPSQAVASAVKELTESFRPYWKTPSGRPRAMTVMVQFDKTSGAVRSAGIFARISNAIAAGDFCSPKLHRLGILVKIGSKDRRMKDAQEAIELAVKCGLNSVYLDGPSIQPAAEPVAGLLNHFEASELEILLPLAGGNCVELKTKLRIDPATTARHVWTGLSAARNMGFDLGKYGLVPLTLEEQKEVIARIQYWFKSWCAAPVCYIDYPILTENQLFSGPTLAQGIELWLKMVKTQKVRVVLIDTAKKFEGRHLLKTRPGDEKGYLLLSDIQKLDALGKKLGIKVLWAGGITLTQAYEFGKLNVFGIYVTSAAATLKPIGKKYRSDPYLVGVREPTSEAVARVALLMQAGFLVSRLKSHARELETACLALLKLLEGKKESKIGDRERKVHALTVEGWRQWTMMDAAASSGESNTLKPKLLRDARVYLSGPMDFVASRENERKKGWRHRVGEFLRALGATTFDPWFKPEIQGLKEYGIEDEKTTSKRAEWTFQPGAAGAAARASCSESFWPSMHTDLRMVDTSDFIVAFCPTNIYSVGTPHEIILCRQQRKPVLFVSPPVRFPALDELESHLRNQGDKKALKLLESLRNQVPIKENPDGVPSLWYLPLIGGEHIFDGFGFATYRKHFRWPETELDSHEKEKPPRKPLLPFIEELNEKLPQKWCRTLMKFVPNDDWLLWRLRRPSEGGASLEDVHKK